MFKQDKKMMLFCVGSRSEIVKMKEIATQIDKKAFISGNLNLTDDKFQNDILNYIRS